MKPRLTREEFHALKNCVRLAKDWRGSMIGNPDKLPLRLFDADMKRAKIALRKVHLMAIPFP